MELDKFYKQF